MEHFTTESLLKALIDSERLADEILVERRKIVDMDRIRNKNREALGALKRPNKLTMNEEHLWMNLGNFFVRTDKDQLVKLLEGDQQYLDKEIDKTRNELKPKVLEMNKVLGKPELQGFDLQPLSKEEITSIRQATAPRVL